MATMRNISFREINNVRIASRLRQVVVLILAVIVGMLISVSVNAQNRFQKNNTRFYKSKFKHQTSQYANACNLLAKKRNHKQKGGLHLASFTKRKNRNTTTAEIDYFANVQSSPKSIKTKSATVAQVE